MMESRPAARANVKQTWHQILEEMVTERRNRRKFLRKRRLPWTQPCRESGEPQARETTSGAPPENKTQMLSAAITLGW